MEASHPPPLLSRLLADLRCMLVFMELRMPADASRQAGSVQKCNGPVCRNDEAEKKHEVFNHVHLFQVNYETNVYFYRAHFDFANRNLILQIESSCTNSDF